jgi:transposase
MRTIGIDVSKATLDVALRDEQGIALEKQVKNSPAALRALLRSWTKRGLCQKSTLVCLEPTGHYSLGVIKTLLDMGQPTWMAHPNDIRLSIGMQRGKSDKVDARRIAEYAHRYSDKARLITPAYLGFAELRSLLALRQRMITQRSGHRVQLKDNALYQGKSIKTLVRDELERQVKSLERSLKKLEAAITAMIAADEVVQRKKALAQTVSGIGPVLASELVAHTEGFTRFKTPRQMVCYVGCAPFERTSGSSVRGRTATSPCANKRLKSLLRLAALAAVRTPGDLRDYYIRKTEQGKRPVVALNNVAGKIIHHLWAVLASGKPYQSHLQVS